MAAAAANREHTVTEQRGLGRWSYSARVRVLVWILIWVTLVLAAVVFLAVRARMLWRQTKTLGRELAVAQSRLDEVSSALEQVGADAPDEPHDIPAIFQSPLDARVRQMQIRQEHKDARAARRAATRPAWAQSYSYGITTDKDPS